MRFCVLCFCPQGNNVSQGGSSENPGAILVTRVMAPVLETPRPALAKNSKMNTETSLKLGTLSPGSGTAMSEDAVLLSPVELVELLAGPNPSPYWCRARGPAFTLLVEEEKKLCSAKFTHLGLSTVSLHPMPGNLNRRHWERSTSSGKRTRCCQDCAGKFGQQPGRAGKWVGLRLLCPCRHLFAGWPPYPSWVLRGASAGAQLDACTLLLLPRTGEPEVRSLALGVPSL